MTTWETRLEENDTDLGTVSYSLFPAALPADSDWTRSFLRGGRQLTRGRGPRPSATGQGGDQASIARPHNARQGGHQCWAWTEAQQAVTVAPMMGRVEGRGNVVEGVGVYVRRRPIKRAYNGKPQGWRAHLCGERAAGRISGDEEEGPTTKRICCLRQGALAGAALCDSAFCCALARSCIRCALHCAMLKRRTAADVGAAAECSAIVGHGSRIAWPPSAYTSFFIAHPLSPSSRVV